MRFKVTASEGQTSTRCLMVPKGTVGSYQRFNNTVQLFHQITRRVLPMHKGRIYFIWARNLDFHESAVR